MKKIHVIENIPDGLRIIKSHLSDISGEYSVFNSVGDALSAGETSDLVILLAQRNLDYLRRDMETLYKSNSFSRIPLIVCLPFGTSERSPVKDIIHGTTSFELPVNKLKFLSAVSRYLKVPPRRVLQMVITIQSSDDNIKYTGISIDFSENGMAFKSNADFPVGHRIMVNFVNPVTRKRLFLKAKVIRRTDIRHDSVAFYGVTFVNAAPEDSLELRSFVTGGK
ncbi:MAG: PilZ domain-containing protein [Nitrospiraceae bacterium]|nr:PilZ domain-containing protein [Nitrospiraceae bacterium]